MKLKKLLKIVYFLIVVQLLRIALKNVAFLIIKPSIMSNLYLNTVFMIIFTAIIINIMRKEKNVKYLKIPIKKKNSYLICTALITIFGIIGLIIEKASINSVVLFCYSVLVIPIFEEVLFRGFLWQKIKGIYKKDWIVFIIITVLFSVWHLGYIDSIILHCIVKNNSFSFSIMLWKMFVGLCFGLSTGIGRLKFKNVYATYLIHALGNILGK